MAERGAAEGSTPGFARVPEGFEAWPLIVADVSGLRDIDTQPEVHRLSPTAHHGGGLRVTACGKRQASIHHGWFYLENSYQLGRIERGDWPICPRCVPLGITRDVVRAIRGDDRPALPPARDH